MLTDTYEKQGIKLTDLFGVRYPEYFIHPAAEYAALTQHAGVLDLTHWHILRLAGKDRASFLHNMLTHDVLALETNHGCHSLLTTIKGKIISDLFVYARADDILIFVAQGDGEETKRLLEKHIIMEEVTIEDESLSRGVLGLEGPKAFDILWRMFPPHGPAAKKPFQAVTCDFEDTPVFVMNHSVGGGPGYHMMLPAAELERFHSFLVQAARGSDGLPAGAVAWNMHRIENGVPWHGVDFSSANFPDEARLGDTIDYTKGCFHGQETLARLHHRGHVKRVLVGLTPEESSVPESLRALGDELEAGINSYDETGLRENAPAAARALDLSEIFPHDAPLVVAGGGDDASDRAAKDDKPVGSITSAAYSPHLKRPLLLGYVRYEIAQPGTRLIMRSGGTSVLLTIVDLPASG